MVIKCTYYCILKRKSNFLNVLQLTVSGASGVIGLNVHGHVAAEQEQEGANVMPRHQCMEENYV